jgi:hypothetical protein
MALLQLHFSTILLLLKIFPLGQIVNWIICIALRGLIGFVPKSDITVGKILALEEDIFGGYFEKDSIKNIIDKVNAISFQMVFSSA